MPAYSRNLVLVHSEGWQARSDFYAIKTHVEALCSDIEVFVVSNDIASSVSRKQAAHRPSLIFSPVRLLVFRPERGKVYAGRPMSKLVEMETLRHAGLPVPDFEAIAPDRLPSETRFGPLVIVKPSYALASWGQGIELRRTESVRYHAPEDYPADHPGRRAPMIAQRFVDCGMPMSCRVLTLFGEPIFTYWRQSTRSLRLDPRKQVYDQADYMPSLPYRTAFVSRDPEMLALAKAAQRAFPDIALHACDILRDRFGRLHLLEVNPGGGTWMFSSPGADTFHRMLAIDNLAEPFDAFRTCARLLVARTRAEAS